MCQDGVTADFQLLELKAYSAIRVCVEFVHHVKKCLFLRAKKSDTV